MSLALLRYRDAGTPVHRLDPRAKLGWALAVAAVAFVFYQPLALAIVFASVAPFAALARSLGAWARAMAWLAVAAAVIVALNLLLVPGEPLASLSTPWFIVSATAEGLAAGLAMSLRLLAVAGAFLVLVFTTHPNDLAEGLRRLGMAGWASFSLATAFRFVPAVAEDFRTVQDAQLARGLRSGGGLAARARGAAAVLVPAFAASIRRSQRLAEALEARGYQPGARRTSLYPLRLRTADRVVLGACLVLVAAAVGARVLPM